MEILCRPLPMALAAGTATNGGNALNERIGRAASFTTGQTARYDLGASTSIDTAAVLATNAGTGTTVRIQLSNNGDMSAPVYDSGVISMIASPEALLRVHRSNVFTFAAVNARYVQFTFASMPVSPLTVGRLLIGKRFTPAEPRDYDWDFSVIDLGENRRAANGLEDPTIRGKVMSYSWSWTGLTRAEARGAMLDLMAYAGNTRDLLLCLDATAADKHNLIGYGKLPDAVIVPNTAEDWYEAKFTLLSRLVLAL